MATRTLTVVLAGDTKGLSGALNRAGGGLGKFGKLAASAGAAAAAGFGIATIAGVKMGSDLDKGLSEVRTLLPDLSNKGFRQLRNDVVAFSNAMGVATKDAVPALYQAISAGVPRDNVISFLETANKAAVGGVTDLETAVDGITSVINAYGTDVISATKASDLMFTAVKLGKTDFEQLSGSLFNVVPIAAAAGVSFEDVTAGLARLTAQGTPTSVAATQLRAAIQALVAPSVRSKQHLDNLGVSFDAATIKEKGLATAFDELYAAANGDLEVLRKVIGSVEGVQAILGLTGKNAEGFRDALDEMGASSGATDKAFRTMADTFDFKFRKALNRIKNILLEWGIRVLPVVERGLDFLLPMINKLGDFIDSSLVPALRSAWGWFSDKILPVLAGIWSWIKDRLLPALGDLWTSVRDRVVSALRLLWEWTQDNIIPALRSLRNWITETAIPALRSFGEWAWEKIEPGLTALWEWITETAIPALRSFRDWIIDEVIPALGDFGAWVWGHIEPALSAYVRWLTETAVPALRSFRDWIMDKVVPALHSFGEWAWERIKPALSDLRDWLQEHIIPALGSFRDRIVDEVIPALGDFWDRLRGDDGVLSTLYDWFDKYINPALQIFWRRIKEELNPVLEDLRSLLENRLIPSLKSFWESLGEGEQDGAVANFKTAMDNLARIAGFTLLYIADLHVKWIADTIAGFGVIVRWIDDNWEPIWTLIVAPFELAYRLGRSWLDSLIALLAGDSGAMIDAIRRGWGAIFDFVTDMGAALIDLARSIGGDIVHAFLESFYGLADQIASIIGDAVSSATSSIPDWVPGFASGGYVPATPGGRIIRVAEGGEGEYIIPQSRIGRMSGSSGNTINLTINAPGGDPRVIANAIMPALEELQQNGRLRQITL